MQGRGFAIVGARRPYPGPWIAFTWTRDPATELWTNAPVPGDELLDGWTNNVTFPFETLITVETSITSAVNSAGYAMCHKNIGPVAIGEWYLTVISNYVLNSGNHPFIRSAGGSNLSISPWNFNMNLPNINIVWPITTARATEYIGFYVGNNLASNFSTGAISTKKLTLSQLIAYRNYGRQVSIAAALTMTANIPGGVVSRLSVNGDGTLNFVHCWHDGTNLHLDTVVNSYTVVSKINAAAAYGAGRIIKINFSAANTAQAFYNGVQIGTDQDISAVPPGTRAGLFATDPTVTLGMPVWS